MSTGSFSASKDLRKSRRRDARYVRRWTLVLILTGLAGIEGKVKGLGFGADDYMAKPFHKDELVACIHAVVRRSKGHAQSVNQTSDLVVNLDSKMVEINGASVHLTGKEYQMLELLALRKGTTLTKETFLNHLYGGTDEPELKIIDVFICKLRKKLANASNGKNYIEAIWGRGYVMREAVDDEARATARVSRLFGNCHSSRAPGKLGITDTQLPCRLKPPPRAGLFIQEIERQRGSAKKLPRLAPSALTELNKLFREGLPI